MVFSSIQLLTVLSLHCDSFCTFYEHFNTSGLTIGDTVDGFIAHCENTDAIYIHLTKNKDEIDTMYESIATHYKGGKGVNVAEVLEDGCYVTKFSEDGEWYRSKVINIDNTNVKVSSYYEQYRHYIRCKIYIVYRSLNTVYKYM